MKRERSGIGVLLVSLVTFTGVIGFLHYEATVTAQTETEQALSPALSTQLETVNFEEVAMPEAALAQVPTEQAELAPPVGVPQQAAQELLLPSKTQPKGVAQQVFPESAADVTMPAESDLLGAEPAPFPILPGDESAAQEPEQPELGTIPPPADLPDLKPVEEEKAPEAVSGLAEVSVVQVVELLRPLIASRSVEKIAESFNKVPTRLALLMVESIFNIEDSNLTRNDRLELLFALAKQRSSDEGAVDAVLDVLLERAFFAKDDAVLLVATEHYSDLIPVILSWADRYPQRLQAQIQSAQAPLSAMGISALQEAVSENKVEAFQFLLQGGVALDERVAKGLLERVVRESKDPGFIAVLAPIAKDINFFMNDKKTLLMVAAQAANEDLVEALVAAGADVKIESKSPAIGNALQLTIQKQMESAGPIRETYTRVIELLRERGARE